MNVQKGSLPLRWIVVLACAGLAGCAQPYFKVTDPASGKEYYTREVEDKGKAGAVTFKDDKTGGAVTLQSSEVKQIDGDEYQAALGKQ